METIKNFLEEITWTIWNWITNKRDWFRYKFIYKKHIIIVGKPQWYDSDTRILNGMMKVLEEYVEEENPLELTRWSNGNFQEKVEDEFMYIYFWWKNYQNRKLEIDDRFYEYFKKYPMSWKSVLRGKEELFELVTENADEKMEDYKKIQQLELKLLEEETDMLTRLIQIRHYLWT